MAARKATTVDETAMTDMVEQANAQVKEAMGKFNEFASKATEENKAFVETMFKTNQAVLEDSFAMWQEYSKVYSDFFIGAMKDSVTQSLSMRESVDKVMVDSFKKAQEIVAEEQQVVFEATEAMQAQLQANVERISKMFPTVAMS